MRISAGLAKRHPFAALLMLVFMVSLAGIPPTAGFIGKFYVFMSAVEAGLTWLAVTGPGLCRGVGLLLPAAGNGDVHAGTGSGHRIVAQVRVVPGPLHCAGLCHRRRGVLRTLSRSDCEPGHPGRPHVEIASSGSPNKMRRGETRVTLTFVEYSAHHRAHPSQASWTET